jgi:hypothetical protein
MTIKNLHGPLSQDEWDIQALIERWARAESRLTMGLRKIDGCWRVVHEHHSLPAE